MAFDRKNQKLHPGDEVCIPCIVLGIDKHDEYINIALESVEGRYPDGKKELFQINAKQVELVKPLGHSDPNLDVSKAVEDSGFMKAHGK